MQLLVVVLLGVSAQQPSDGCNPRGELAPPLPVANGQFNRCGIHGDVAAVGSTVYGTVEVYRRTGQTWNHEQTLSGGSGYGNAVAVTTDRIACGRNGQVDIWEHNGVAWANLVTLTDSGLGIGISTEFGKAVDLFGNLLIVGAPLGDAQGVSNSGGAFVYQRQSATSWLRIADLHLAAGMNSWLNGNRIFGQSVAISDDYAVVGNPADVPGGGLAVGALHIFSADQGYQFFRVFGDSFSNEQGFGFHVDVSGDFVIQSAHFTGNNTGKAKVYLNSAPPTVAGWALEQDLIPSDVIQDDQAGRDVCIHGNTAWVGARLHDALGIDAGAVYVFKRESGIWVQRKKLGGGMADAGDLLGADMAVGGGRWGVIAAPFGGPIAEGRAFIIDVNNCPLGF